jgi:hypothetical protein
MTKNKKIIIGVVGVVVGVVLVVALLGMYKFNYLAGLVGYDADGNKIKEGVKTEAEPKGDFHLYNCTGDNDDDGYLVKQFFEGIEEEKIKITLINSTDEDDYEQTYDMNYVKSGSGSKFTGTDIQF